MTLIEKLHLGLALARSMGHAVTTWEHDCDRGERMAQCPACDRWMAADGESPTPWGWILVNRCPRRRMG